MGNLINTCASSAIASTYSSSSHHQLAGKKRCAEEMVGEHDVEDVIPQKKRNKSTSDYIYQTLFCQGTDSDITIKALDKKWKLHKIYLCQSKYFLSMFSGNWKESNEPLIEFDIPDLNITVKALDIAFSSLYRDEVPLEEVHMCSTIAAASMLQLDGLLDQCRGHMRENIKSDSIVGYITAASMYGLSDIEDECREWLLLHLLKRYTITLLKDMSCQLLTDLLGSPDLYVMQIEMDVYTLAKKWLFLTQNPDWSGNSDKLLGDAEDYFRTKGDDGSYFLDTQNGREYAVVFEAIRLQHILNDKTSMSAIEDDRIIPQNWLLKLYRQQWLKMLSVDQRLDAGPSGISEEQFNKYSMRCGRVINEPGEYCWRWTGFSFGFDALVIYTSKTGILSIKRNTVTQPCTGSVSLRHRRAIAVRLRVISFHDNKSNLTSGIQQLNLAQDEEHLILKNIPSSQFPIYIGINLSLTSADVF